MRSTITAWRHTPRVLPQTETKIRTAEAAVLTRLSVKEQPLTRAELEQTIAGRPLDVANALHNLAVAGAIELSELHVALTPGHARPIRATVVPLRRHAYEGRAAAHKSTLPVRELPAFASGERIKRESERWDVATESLGG